MRPKHAFILIELLIVVAIIAVLAAIAVPNFLEAQTRSKIARAQMDMSLLKAALRAYSAEHDGPPPNTSSTLVLLRSLKPTPTPRPVYTSGFAPGQVPPGGMSNDANSTVTEARQQVGWDLAVLTTPTPWLASTLPLDPFNVTSKNVGYYNSARALQPFTYVNLAVHAAAEADTTKTLPTAGFVLLSYGPDSQLTLQDPFGGNRVLYDPTNGTTSAGDLIMSGW